MVTETFSSLPGAHFTRIDLQLVKCLSGTSDGCLHLLRWQSSTSGTESSQWALEEAASISCHGGEVNDDVLSPASLESAC
jgi:hypothetical protein